MAIDKAERTQDRAPETDQFLASVDAKIAALQTLRASYVAALSVGAFGQGSGDTGAFATGAPSLPMGGAPFELPRGALLGKSIPAAIKLYLQAIKRKQSIREIANGLREGGVESTAKNFETPVQSAIYRLQAAGEVLKFKDGWSLSEFYPESLRNRIAEKDTKPRRKKKTKVARPKASKPAAASVPSSRPIGTTNDLESRIEAFLRQQAKPVEASAVAQAVDAPSNVVGLALGRMKVQQRVHKSADGGYSLAA